MELGRPHKRGRRLPGFAVDMLIFACPKCTSPDLSHARPSTQSPPTESHEGAGGVGALRGARGSSHSLGFRPPVSEPVGVEVRLEANDPWVQCYCVLGKRTQR